MTIEQLFIIGIGVACSVLGWFARVLYMATQELRKDLSILEIKISTDYIRYDRLQDALKPIIQTLAEIKHTLDRKADK